MLRTLCTLGGMHGDSSNGVASGHDNAGDVFGAETSVSCSKGEVRAESEVRVESEVRDEGDT